LIRREVSISQGNRRAPRLQATDPVRLVERILKVSPEVRSLMPKAAATSSTGRRSSTIQSTISAQPSGAVRAFLCGLFILVHAMIRFETTTSSLAGDEQPPHNHT